MRAQTKWFFIVLLGVLILSSFAMALPSAPSINYYANSSAASGIQNRSTDEKGTITVVTLSANQQDYKWKAYVGNITGKVALDDASGMSIYDWNLGVSSGGEVYVSRFSNINWANMSCATQASIDAEQTGISMGYGSDSINATFNETTHRAFNVSTTQLSGCRSTATYLNDAPQTMGPTARFQEVLIRDSGSNRMVYTTFIEPNINGYDNHPHNFQLLVAENESATVPTTYFFWVELG